MKLTRITSSSICLSLLFCMLLYSNLTADEYKQYKQAMPQAQEINERLNLYKRIRQAQHNKVLMQLLHDIANIQKQCKDKGYLCNAEGLSVFNSPTMGVRQPPLPSADTVLEYTPNRIAAPNINLLGIVGGRARFRLSDGSIQDFSLDELIADTWKVAKISSDAVTLIHNEKSDIKVSYQIDRNAWQDLNTIEGSP